MQNERDVKTAVKDVLKAHNVWYFMPAMNGYGRPGIPDIVACVDGHFLGIETKYGKNYLSATQEAEGKAITKAGGKWLVVYETNVDDVRAAIAAMRAK